MTLLRTRLQKLEEGQPLSVMSRCLVIHSENCESDRERSVTSYIERYGQEPSGFMDVLLVSAETKRNICGCHHQEETCPN